MTLFQLCDSDKRDSVLFFDAILFLTRLPCSKGTWARLWYTRIKSCNSDAGFGANIGSERSRKSLQLGENVPVKEENVWNFSLYFAQTNKVNQHDSLEYDWPVWLYFAQTNEVNQGDSLECDWPVWLYFAQTNEVNQGDSLEYNFDCMYTTLLLPITHRLGARVVQVCTSVFLWLWRSCPFCFVFLSVFFFLHDYCETPAHEPSPPLLPENSAVIPKLPTFFMGPVPFPFPATSPPHPPASHDRLPIWTVSKQCNSGTLSASSLWSDIEGMKVWKIIQWHCLKVILRCFMLFHVMTISCLY